ncbi:MAG: tRNA 2-methylthio-N6-isopentenyl adenosine(37) hydroxylase MiaE [Bacteroidetes bacterium MED-G17]|nr:MAG: tRNA 2-methylthio-N6-isopentenyl adenosine(37) hydroxylase MiaE [Bacteroidetes bacterium MED-G17]|tara:strand:+ start:1419 stop:2000 length:582 start_codon:yes stop_codon:yes gene_type:complete
MLGLKLPTDPRWVNIAEKSIDEVLIDHAYCEQKAATSGISLIVRFSEYEEVVEKVTPLVAEEWGHFRKVLKELKKRGFALGPQRRDEYVNKLIAFQQKGGGKEKSLLENLLICALIEARSCERFRLLSTQLEDEALCVFYHEFMVSEAGHYRMFLDLAYHYLPQDEVKERWQAYLDFEGEMIRDLALRGDRMH